MEKLALFGNGLGMAISSEAYNLSYVMNDIWNGSFISNPQKQLILACLPEGIVQPTSEDHLGVLQKVVAACETLKRIPESDVGHWLTEVGQDFPEAVARFSFLVSREMYLAKYKSGESEGEYCKVPSSFTRPFVDAVKDGKLHIATLNYDGLISDILTSEGIINENNGSIRDGFINLRFDRRHLFRPGNKGAWYMHLHGSPLFTDRGSSPFRYANSTIIDDIASLKEVGRHIVLSHFDHKRSLIESSAILSVYWEFFERSIEESSEIILFGYSGNDLHVNRMIAQLRAQKTIRVVEWIGAGTKAVREPFWKAQLGGDVALHQLDDVLAFSEW